ncbi:MAG: hypothetical protein KGL39_52210 [Patescibacteria group bacterium]|nr:hypothetical protein [Patescibacteria group bacterium]
MSWLDKGARAYAYAKFPHALPADIADVDMWRSELMAEAIQAPIGSRREKERNLNNYNEGISLAEEVLEHFPEPEVLHKFLCFGLHIEDIHMAAMRARGEKEVAA